MYHRMPPSKTGWPSLTWWFFHLWCASSWTNQNSDHPADYWSNSPANLGRPPAGFQLNQQLSNWASQVSGLGPSFMKIWPCGSSPRSGSWNAWMRIKNVNGASRLSNFWNFFGTIEMIACHDWRPWTKPGYITMTRRQSNNQWSGSVEAHPTPKNSECKNPLEKFSPQFFGIKTASSLLIIFQGARLSMRNITHLCWCNWRTFWRKNAAGTSPRGVLFLHDNALAHQALATHKKLVYLGFQWLDHPPYSTYLALSDYHLFPGLKKQLKGRHFSYDVEVTAAAETWLDGQPSNFFFFE